MLHCDRLRKHMTSWVNNFTECVCTKEFRKTIKVGAQTGGRVFSNTRGFIENSHDVSLNLSCKRVFKIAGLWKLLMLWYEKTAAVGG